MLWVMGLRSQIYLPSHPTWQRSKDYIHLLDMVMRTILSYSGSLQCVSLHSQMKTLSPLLVEHGIIWKIYRHIRGLGMEGIIYKEDFESHILIIYTAGIRYLILQQPPSHQYGTLIAIWNSLVAGDATAQIVSQLGEKECLRARQNLHPIETRET